LTPRERAYGATLYRGLNLTMPTKATHCDNLRQAMYTAVNEAFWAYPDLDIAVYWALGHFVSKGLHNALCWGAETRFATESLHSKLENYLVGIGA
jgi:hypothetical protein